MEKSRVLVSADEQAQISRKLLVFLNQFPDKPVSRINYEYLSSTDGMAVSTIQAAYKTKRYIDGGYRAQYQFRVIYRVAPGSNDERLTAEEITNAIGVWAEANAKNLSLGEKITVLHIARDTIAALYARYEGGIEDYQILMNLEYEVNV